MVGNEGNNIQKLEEEEGENTADKEYKKKNTRKLSMKAVASVCLAMIALGFAVPVAGQIIGIAAALLSAIFGAIFVCGLVKAMMPTIKKTAKSVFDAAKTAKDKIIDRVKEVGKGIKDFVVTTPATIRAAINERIGNFEISLSDKLRSSSDKLRKKGEENKSEKERRKSEKERRKSEKERRKSEKERRDGLSEPLFFDSSDVGVVGGGTVHRPPSMLEELEEEEFIALKMLGLMILSPGYCGKGPGDIIPPLVQEIAAKKGERLIILDKINDRDSLVVPEQPEGGGEKREKTYYIVLENKPDGSGAKAPHYSAIAKNEEGTEEKIEVPADGNCLFSAVKAAGISGVTRSSVAEKFQEKFLRDSNYRQAVMGVYKADLPTECEKMGENSLKNTKDFLSIKNIESAVEGQVRGLLGDILDNLDITAHLSSNTIFCRSLKCIKEALGGKKGIIQLAATKPESVKNILGELAANNSKSFQNIKNILSEIGQFPDNTSHTQSTNDFVDFLVTSDNDNAISSKDGKITIKV